MASTYSNLLIHIIFATKNRAPMIDMHWMSDLHAFVGGILRRNEAVPIAIGGISDHIHIFTKIRPSHSVADLVREVKKATHTWGKDKLAIFGWQEGYAALSVGRSERDRLVRYIQNQEEHHKKESSQDELRRLLDKEGIEYDPRFFE